MVTESAIFRYRAVYAPFRYFVISAIVSCENCKFGRIVPPHVGCYKSGKWQKWMRKNSWCLDYKPKDSR